MIDRDGIVRYGPTEYDTQALIDLIGELLRVRADAGHAGDAPAIQLRWDPVGGRRIRDFGLFPYAGENRVSWDGRDALGRQVPNGVYYLQLRNAAARASQRVLRVN